ncbi:MAG: hypothetical protein SAK29_09600, partial [Scytonema sp. PMC 1069.18]|nr:hypothetical protein [Scytonema sp. PMC 1069.18]
YLGKRSITHLQTFLDGYTFGLRQVDVPVTEEEQEFEKFQEWIEQRFNQHSTQSWSRIILFYSEDEIDALERFFELFEEFLQSDKSLPIDKREVTTEPEMQKKMAANILGTGIN